MTREGSIYLDLARFLLALIVCLGHLSERSAWDYTTARAARIYSVPLPS